MTQIYKFVGVASPVRLNPDVPDELEHIIEKCLEKDRTLRYLAGSQEKDL